MILDPAQIYKQLLSLSLLLLLSACSSLSTVPTIDPSAATRELIDNSAKYAGHDEYLRLLYESRTWVPSKALAEESVEFGKRARIPIQNVGAKILGPSYEDALRSLALKIWMIEQAEHTVDAVYYIFKQDLVGQALLGALCNAVQRGVDVRIMVDATGSFSLTHNKLRKLQECARDAGYMRNASQQQTSYKARIQTVVFNALTSTTSWINRRSHDKLLVADGAFPGKALVMTGGRNISLDYYGLNSNGSPDPAAYRDLEIFLQPRSQETFADFGIGNISEIYFSLLFLHKGNKKLLPMHSAPPSIASEGRIIDDSAYKSAQDSLSKLKSFPQIQQSLADMPDYLQSDVRDAQVRLAHELGNLTNRNVVRKTQENLAGNENSIMRLIDEIGYARDEGGVLKIVSPYIFMAKYYGENGEVIQDDAKSIHQWLADNPDSRVEIITNSVLTSDNFMAQSIIDMDMAPRLLLPPDIETAWLAASEKGEVLPALVETDRWDKLINNPRILIYQTGKLDSVRLGSGNQYYGKLHAKFIAGDDIGFIGTTNFDYRSRLFNNEMGFFFHDEQLYEDLGDTFEFLKATSYRWGSAEWLEMRQQVMKVGGMKAWSTRQQRGIFKFLRATGLDWLI